MNCTIANSLTDDGQSSSPPSVPPLVLAASSASANPETIRRRGEALNASLAIAAMAHALTWRSDSLPPDTSSPDRATYMVLPSCSSPAMAVAQAVICSQSRKSPVGDLTFFSIHLSMAFSLSTSTEP